MAHAVAADPHSGGSQRADASLVEEPRLTESAGDDEEGRGQAAPAQRRESVLNVGGVAVVEGDPDIAAPHDRVERGLELIRVEPDLLLARLQRSARARRCRGK